jgi:hypothetical protein
VVETRSCQFLIQGELLVLMALFLIAFINGRFSVIINGRFSVIMVGKRCWTGHCNALSESPTVVACLVGAVMVQVRVRVSF